MSYLERTARKLMPILVEIKKRMIPEKNLQRDTSHTGSIIKSGPKKGKIETIDVGNDEDDNEDDSEYKKANGGVTPDMKNILGYLN